MQELQKTTETTQEKAVPFLELYRCVLLINLSLLSLPLSLSLSLSLERVRVCVRAYVCLAVTKSSNQPPAHLSNTCLF